MGPARSVVHTAGRPGSGWDWQAAGWSCYNLREREVPAADVTSYDHFSSDVVASRVTTTGSGSGAKAPETVRFCMLLRFPPR